MVIADTVKGKGVSFMEHSVLSGTTAPRAARNMKRPLKELEAARQAMRDTFTRCLEALRRDAPPSWCWSPATWASACCFPYMKKFPDRFINAGISEQAMMSMAAGMALEGKTVVVYSIGNFPTLRCSGADPQLLRLSRGEREDRVRRRGLRLRHAGHDPSCPRRT